MSKGLKNCLPFFLLFTIITLLVKDNGFFWDTILQSSKYGHYYFETNFASILVPENLDAGHPPLFGIYIALVWKLFGKSLIVSHLAMLPFLFGIVWQVYRLINYFSVKHFFPILLLVLTNAVLLGHGTLVSPDIAFLFFFLLGLNGVLYLKKWQIILGTICLGWLSIRGVFAIAALMAIHFKIDKKLKPLLVFLPALITGLAYYTFHYVETGWWISTPHEGWAHHRGLASPSIIFRNIIVLGWRLVDFGNIIYWLLFGFLFLKSRNVFSDQRMKTLFSIPVLILLIYSPALLLFQNPIGHRYLLPIYILFALLVSVWFVQSPYFKKWIFALILIVQISGSFWVYPKTIAQGWDSTMGHLPYYDLMDEMKNYLHEKDIAFSDVGTEFPNIGSRKYIDLNDHAIGFAEKDLATQEYILYSTVFNDFSDEEFEKLENDWLKEKHISWGSISVILYKKP